MIDPLMDHQVAALRKLSNGKILWGGVGSGKTRVAAEYYKLREAPRDVYVITTAKKRDDFDWQEQFYELGVGPRSGPAGPERVLQKGHRLQRQVRGTRSSHGDDQDFVQAGVGMEGNGSGTSVGMDNVPELSRDEWTGSTAVHRVQSEDGGTGASPNSGRTDIRVSAAVGSVRARGDHGGDGSARGDVLSRSDAVAWEASVYPYVVTVDSWNNIAKYANVMGAFFIFDEQRLVGSGNWTRKFLRIAKHNHWILLSATPGDTWLDYIPVFVANRFYKNRTEFLREHVVYNTFTKFPKVDRYVNVGRLVRQRSQLLVEMPFKRHTTRHIVETPLCYDKELLDQVLTKRWHVYEDRPLRDVAEMFLVGRRVVFSDPSRLEMVCELWKTHPRLIVFYNFNFELESLRSLKEYYEIENQPTKNMSVPSTQTLNKSSIFNSSMLLDSSYVSTSVAMAEASEWTSRDTTNTAPSLRGGGSPAETIRPSLRDGYTDISASSMSLGRTSSGTMCSSATVPESIVESSTTMVSEWNGHKHQPVPTTDRWLYLVQYTAGAEGWNCTTTDAMIMYSRNYSWKVTEQAYGRIDRLNTPFKDLWYYDFTSDSFIDKAIGRSLKAKETFNEAKFKDVFKS